MKLQLENYFTTSLLASVTDSIVGEIELQLSVAPQSDFGYLIVDFVDETLREEFFYHRKVGNSVFVYGINRVNAQAHDVAASVQINDSASLFNYMSNLLPDHFFMYKTGASTCYIRGGDIYDNGEYKVIADKTDFTFTTGTHYLYIEDGAIAKSTSSPTDKFVFGEIVVDGLGEITSFENYNTIALITERTNQILRGTGSPSGALGINGDFYFDDENKDLYGPKFDGTDWGVGYSLVGEQGLPGPAGPTGPAGSITEAADETEATINTNTTTGATITTDGTTYIRLTNADTSYTNFGLTAITSVDKNGNTSRTKTITGSFTVPDTSGITYTDGLFVDKITGTTSFTGAPVYRDFDNTITGFNIFGGLTQFDGQVKFSYNVNSAEVNLFNASLGTKQGFNFASGPITMNFSNLTEGVTLTFAVTVVTAPVTLTFGTATDIDSNPMGKLGIGITAVPELAVGTHLFAAEVFTEAIHIAYLGQSQAFV